MDKRDVLVDIRVPLSEHPDAGFGNSVYGAGGQNRERYMAALLRELEAAAPSLEGCRVRALRIGGGCPTEGDMAALWDLTARIASLLCLAEGCEIGLEAFPVYTLKALEAGTLPGPFGRLDLVLRSAADAELQNLFTPALWRESRACVAALRERGFTNYGLYYNFGIPGQSRQSLGYTLRRLEECPAPGIRLLPFPRRAGEGMYALYEDFAARLLELGYSRISAQDFLRPGEHSAFRRLLAAGMEYVGFGLGARTRFEGFCYHNSNSLARYFAHSAAPESLYMDVREAGGLGAEMARYCELALQGREGLGMDAFAARFGGERMPESLRSQLRDLLAGGIVSRGEGDVLRLSPRGFGVWACQGEI